MFRHRLKVRGEENMTTKKNGQHLATINFRLNILTKFVDFEIWLEWAHRRHCANFKNLQNLSKTSNFQSALPKSLRIFFISPQIFGIFGKKMKQSTLFNLPFKPIFCWFRVPNPSLHYYILCMYLYFNNMNVCRDGLHSRPENF